MKQHNIQEAYLKNFALNGKIWVHDTKGKTASLKPASKCTIEEDFQSEYLEKIQNTKIESPGIKKLNKLVQGGTIDKYEYLQIRYWTALHIIRNKKYRSLLGDDYETNFDKLMEIENKFSLYFSYCYKYKCSNNQFFITSDNPIIEFTVGTDIIRVFTLSPTDLLLFTPVDSTVFHEEIEFTELINSMLWANSFSQVFSHRKELPILTYEKNIANFNLEAVFEETQFYMEKQISDPLSSC